MGLLKENIQYIKDREKEIADKDNLGQEIEIINQGDRSECTNPLCSYDSFYKQSTNPDCEICGGKWWIYTEITYDKEVLVKWYTGEEEEETEAGKMKVGDCRIKADYDDLEIFQTALDEKTILTLDTGEKFIITTITPTALRTSVLVYLTRKEE